MNPSNDLLREHLQPLIISAPFGNYVQPRGATPTLGTFTAASRPGRVWRIARTLRYYPRLGAWVNKIGLRNPGIHWLANKVQLGKIDPTDKLLSIHGFNAEDWAKLLAQAAVIKPLGLELNMSCPNVGEIHQHHSLFRDAVETGLPIVVKLPPIRFMPMVDAATAAGITAFHACNTLPVPAGGMSGKPLKPLALRCIEDLRARPDGDSLFLIGGGGIHDPADLDEYQAAGADRFAVGVKSMNPRLLWTDKPLKPLLDRAAMQSSPHH